MTLPFYGHVIDGVETESIDGARMDSIDPYTREPWAQVALGAQKDADAAVAAVVDLFARRFDEGD